jgi:23S rRNA (uracil1939-C5)-methyltransferase
LKNCEFARGNVGALLPKILATLDAAATCVLLDPPRAGCEPPVIEALRQIRPKQIIYISCNPPALARDLKKLLAPSVAAGAARQAAAAHFGGYKLSRVVPLDMFPQTAHCEVIAQLHLVEKLQAT